MLSIREIEKENNMADGHIRKMVTVETVENSLAQTRSWGIKQSERRRALLYIVPEDRFTGYNSRVLKTLK